MNRKLLILWFCLSCSSIRPADPLLVEHALQNETDEGFISREFFQVKVEVPYSFKEMSGRAKREECRQAAFLKREEQTIKYLIEVHRDKPRFADTIDDYNASRLGQARLAKNSSSSSPTGLPSAVTTPTNQTSQPGTQTGQTQTQTPGPNSGLNPAAVKSKEKLDQKTYSQVFSWFLSDLTLYKEDYTDKLKCTFLFRNIQKDLFAKVENTIIPDSMYRKKEKDKEDEKD